MTPPTKRLLVLDLNGTILHRLTHTHEAKLFRNHPVVLGKNIKPDITVNGCKIVYRPHAQAFLKHVLKHFDVAVWTSSRPQNALPMVHYSFRGLLDVAGVLEEAERREVAVRQVILGPSDAGAELMKLRLLEETKGLPKLQFIWTQEECDIVTVKPSESLESSVLPKKPSAFSKPIRKKNLSKIYKSFFDYDPTNTLIIDDTDAKIADHVDNHLKVDEFTVIDYETDFTQDGGLLRLKKFLEKLLSDDPRDVRTFLASHRLEEF